MRKWTWYFLNIEYFLYLMQLSWYLRVWHNGCAPAFQAGYRSSTLLTRSSGGIPERPKGADCKSAAECFDGSNPSPTTIFFSHLDSHPDITIKIFVSFVVLIQHFSRQFRRLYQNTIFVKSAVPGHSLPKRRLVDKKVVSKEQLSNILVLAERN